jgi:hypothetical protein
VAHHIPTLNRALPRSPEGSRGRRILAFLRGLEIFLNKPFHAALTTPFNGYWHFGPRVLAEVASHFPIEWAPGVMSGEAALVTSLLGLVVYLASGAYFKHPALRLLAAVPVVLAPAGIGWVENNVATLHFPLLYGLFWALLWWPNIWWGRCAALAIVLTAAFSSPLAIVFVPFAIGRLIIRRDLLGSLLVLGLLGGVGMQFGGQALGNASRAGIGTPRYDPIWAIGDYLEKVVPTAIFGEKWTFDRMDPGICPQFIVSQPREHAVLVAGAALILVGVVLVALRLSRPAWTLAIVAAAHSVMLYSVSIMTLGCAANRYFVAPALLLLTAIAAMLRPRESAEPPMDTHRLSAPAIVFLTLATVVCIVNLRSDSPRSGSPRWTDLVNVARQQCVQTRAKEVTLAISPGWFMQLHCTALTK